MGLQQTLNPDFILCLSVTGVKSCWFTYLIRNSHSSCELPLHGDLRVGFTPLSADVSKGVTLASGYMVRALELNLKETSETVSSHPDSACFPPWISRQSTD